MKPSHAQKVGERRTWKNSFCSGEPAAVMQRDGCGISPGVQELTSIRTLFSEFTLCCRSPQPAPAALGIMPDYLCPHKGRLLTNGWQAWKPVAPALLLCPQLWGSLNVSPEFPGMAKPSDPQGDLMSCPCLASYLPNFSPSQTSFNKIWLAKGATS